jgi:hypothetical protein
LSITSTIAFGRSNAAEERLHASRGAGGGILSEPLPARSRRLVCLPVP